MSQGRQQINHRQRSLAFSHTNGNGIYNNDKMKNNTNIGQERIQRERVIVSISKKQVSLIHILKYTK